MIVMENTVFRRGIPGLIPDAWIVNPDNINDAPPVVVVHGIQRQVRAMADLLSRRAAETDRTVILPHFDTTHWPRYQRAACPNRADIALLSLMRHLTREGRVAKGRFDLSGFSGGAQFAHRFAWIYPDSVGRLSLTAPGWWTFPDAQIAWPYGIGSADAKHRLQGLWLQANLKPFLARDIDVRVGSEDTLRDPNLRKGADIDVRQGLTRVDRARNWAQAMRDAAHAINIPPHITFDTLPGCGHSFSECVVQAQLDRVFIVPAKAHSNAPKCQTSDLPHTLERSAA